VYVLSISKCRALGLLAAASLAIATQPAFAQSKSPADVTIALSSASFSIGSLRLADQAGFYAENNIKPNFVVMDSGNAAAAALLSNSAQFAASGVSTALAARGRGQPIVCAANIYKGLSASLILAKAVADKTGVSPTAPVEQRLRALEGLTIAVPSATSSFTVPVKQSAEKMGINVKFAYMAQPAMAAALETGAIQGMMAGPTNFVPVIMKGGGVLWIDGPSGQFPKDVVPASSSCLQTTESYAKANPEVVKGMVQALQQTADLIKKDPDKAKSLIAKAFPKMQPDLLNEAFKVEAVAWTDISLTAEDVKHEIALLKAMGSATPALEKLDPASILIKP